MNTIIETPEDKTAQIPQGVAEQNAQLIEVTESNYCPRQAFHKSAY
jgi:hypothetical protein